MTGISFRYICTVALLVATLGAYTWSGRRPSDFLAQPLDTIDKQMAGWTMTGTQPLTDVVLQKLQLTSYLSRTYVKDQSQLDLFVAYYAQQRTGESMHSPKHCLPGAGWEIWKHDSAMVPFNGQQVQINQYSIQNSGRRMLVFYWYQSKDRVLASEYMGKILLAKDTLLSGHTAGSLVRIILPDVPSAPAEGVVFAAQLMPQMQRCLGAAN
jgi:EpsI family protein